MDDLLVLRVSLQKDNFDERSSMNNSELEVSLWYWMEHNYKYEEAMKNFFNKT